ncbi:type I-C CRISPR-associated protein Cas8c/Csd1 [Pseudonocardia sp. T1-2H]|uniref:type I-C CRISPR-associated protein Cas8c/Csd1 n=1 Tax=Pseudonocardia sp. T1-2H TaxID=3128899 RepID=UPI0031019947
MLLHRLVEYAGRDEAAAPFHRERQFGWRLDLRLDGQPETDTLQPLVEVDAKGRARGVVHAVPTMVRTAGVAANLAADDAQYVLGWADEDSKPERVAQCHAAFVDLTHRWADSDEGGADPVARAVSAFYRSGAATALQRPEDCTAKSGVLIAVGGVPAYRAASVPAFWATEVARRKGSLAGHGLCLICGQVGPLLDTLPGRVPSRLVPGATNDTALVSVNERVFGYDLTTQLAASPVCMSCGEAVTAGLVRALDSEHSSTYGGQDSRLAWWTTEEASFDAMTILQQPSAAEVTALLEAVHRGRPAGGQRPDPTKFCSLTVGGNVARIMVRDWLEMPLDQVKTNIAAWFADHEIVSTRPDGPTHHGLGRFALVCGRLVRARDGGRYAEFGAKGADRPDGVHRDLVRAALRRTPLPPSLLAHLVHRVRTDGRLDDARAALLRLILTRHPLTTEKPMPGLDPSNTTPAYVAGRAFAVLEQIQYDASGQRNATYGDRFFAGAISNPRAALVTGQRDAIAWLRKLRRTKPPAAVRHQKALDELFGLLDPTGDVPARTTLHEQSLFLLGYHHQRAHRFASIRAAHATPTDDVDAVEETA